MLKEVAMLNILYKISLWALGALLLTLIVLISVVGVSENVLFVLGLFTLLFMLSSIVLFLVNRFKK